MSNLKRDALTEFFRLCIMTFSIWTMLYTECIYNIVYNYATWFFLVNEYILQQKPMRST